MKIKKYAICSLCIIFFLVVFIASSHSHKKKPHGKESNALQEANKKTEAILNENLQAKSNLEGDHFQVNSNNINKKFQSVIINNQLESEEDFIETYGILILGIATALSLFITFMFAFLKKRFKTWHKYHHVFAFITVLLMLVHAFTAIWLHYFN